MHNSLDREKEMGENGGCMWDGNHSLLENSCSTDMILRSTGNVYIQFLNNLACHIRRNGLKIFYVEKYLAHGHEVRKCEEFLGIFPKKI